MGVAGLFAFLRRKYPLIVEPCDQQGAAAEGEGWEGAQPADASMCDNLYIGQCAAGSRSAWVAQRVRPALGRSSALVLAL